MGCGRKEIPCYCEVMECLGQMPGVQEYRKFTKDLIIAIIFSLREGQHMKNKRITIIICLLIILGTFIMITINHELISFPVNAGSPPPPDDIINGTQYIEGDWNVTTGMIYSDEIIILTGNLTISSGGNLTFNNVTLMMNCTYMDGEYNIEVQEGGTFNIFNGSIITDSPFDVDNNSVSDYEYMFWVRAGSNFSMLESELHEKNQKLQYHCAYRSWEIHSGGSFDPVCRPCGGSRFSRADPRFDGYRAGAWHYHQEPNRNASLHSSNR